MALDSELLDKFERDWNDALAHYEARTTAARLGDTSVAPYNRTSLDPAISSGMQSELFGPLQAKWGLLTEGRGRAAAATPAQTAPRYFQTRAGVFSIDPLTKRPTKVIDVPQRPDDPTLAEREAMATRQKQLSSELRTIDSEMIANQNLLLKTKKAEDKIPIFNRLSSLSRRKAALGTAPVAAPGVPAVDPSFESGFAQRPSEMMRPRPRPQVFMGDPLAFQGPQVPSDWASPGLLYQDEGGELASSDVAEGVPFTMPGPGGVVTEGIDFSGGGPSVDRSVRLLRVKQKGK